MSDPVVRAREPSDLPALITVLESVYQSDGYPVDGVANAASFLSPPGLFSAWVVTVNDIIVGHALVAEPAPGDMAVTAWARQGGDPARVAVLNRLFVDSRARVKGLGKLLVQTAVAWATANGKRLVLEVLEDRKAAAAIYESLGWRRIGEGVHDDGNGGQFAARLYVSP